MNHPNYFKNIIFNIFKKPLEISKNILKEII